MRRARSTTHRPGATRPPKRGGVGGEARLSAAAGSGQRQEPGLRQQPLDLCQFRLSADEGRELGREVVGDPVERLQRRERARQVRVGDLEDLLGAGQVPETVAPEVDERHPGRQGVVHDFGSGPRHDGLAAVGNGPEPGRPDDGRSGVAAPHGPRPRRCGGPSAPGSALGLTTAPGPGPVARRPPRLPRPMPWRRRPRRCRPRPVPPARKPEWAAMAAARICS